MDSQILELAKIIHKSKKVVVVTGAGISTNGGIPDFRSTDGLYNLVKSQYPSANLLKGKDLFDANLFKDPTTTKIFYLFMAKLRTMVNDAAPCTSHEFLKYLDTGKKLQRCYTQNIDSLEKRLQGSIEAKQEFEKRIIQLHGDLDLLICTLCKETFPFSDNHITNFEESIVPPCPSCHRKNETRMMLGKRQVSVGILRPNIILYNEHHSQGDVIADTLSIDLKKKPDLLIVMGTSLKVIGVKRLVKEIASTIRKTGKGVKVVLINKCELGSDWTDFFDMKILEKTSDEVCDDLMREIERIKKTCIGATLGGVKKSEKKENAKIASKKSVIKKEITATSNKVPLKLSAIKKQSPIQTSIGSFMTKKESEVKVEVIKEQVKLESTEIVIQDFVSIGKGKEI